MILTLNLTLILTLTLGDDRSRVIRTLTLTLTITLTLGDDRWRVIDDDETVARRAADASSERRERNAEVIPIQPS